jgi:hypothetical protein
LRSPHWCSKAVIYYYLTDSTQSETVSTKLRNRLEAGSIPSAGTFCVLAQLIRSQSLRIRLRIRTVFLNRCREKRGSGEGGPSGSRRRGRGSAHLRSRSDAIKTLGGPLDAAATEYAQAVKTLAGHSLLDAANFYMRHHANGVAWPGWYPPRLRTSGKPRGGQDAAPST